MNVVSQFLRQVERIAVAVENWKTLEFHRDSVEMELSNPVL